MFRLSFSPSFVGRCANSTGICFFEMGGSNTNYTQGSSNIAGWKMDPD